MDLSALIFVALAVAWAVYLVPKALKAHEADSMTRSVDGFSDRMRVLARRGGTSADGSELVVERAEVEVAETPEAADDEPAPEPLTAAERRGRREAAQRAARRRRRVLGLILLANLAVGGVVAAGLITWPYVAIPAGLLVAWLVACRLMVRHERAERARQPVRRPQPSVDAQRGTAEEAGTADVPAVGAEAADSDGWDPVPITLPTYVEKAPAGRSVRTIDLDSTGVWSSGRNEADSQLAREAESAPAAESDDKRRATGS